MEYVVEDLDEGYEVVFDATVVLDFRVTATGDLVVQEQALPGAPHVTRFEAGAWTRWYLREATP